MSLPAVNLPTDSADEQPTVEEHTLYAALDLGSNSFHLVVGRFESDKLIVLDRHKESVRMASGLRSDGTLQKSAIRRALDSLGRFAERLHPTQVDHLRVVGTNTLRAAKNADGFLAQAEGILGAPIDIISGTEEARLIYLGVANDVAPGERRRLVIDIGGGSTELVVGRAGPEHLESLYIGCVSITEAHFPDGDISEKNYARALLAVRADLQGVVSDFDTSHWDEALGASGTVRAIEGVMEALELAKDHMITIDALDTLSKKLVEFSHVDEINLPNLSEDRRGVFPGGLAVLHGLFLELGIRQMHVSGYALREGIIFDLAGRDGSEDVRQQTVDYFLRQYHVDVPQSQRIARFGRQLFAQVRDLFDDPEWTEQMLVWALSLHEIGLAISHSGYHKHGAYILLHSDMPGFSKQEQKLLSFLVLNHRRKLRGLEQTYGFEPDWRLVQVARLAWLFCRRRSDAALPDMIRLRIKGEATRVYLPSAWIDVSPLTTENLDREKEFLQPMKLKLDIKVLDTDD